MRKPVDEAEIQAFLAKGGTIKKIPAVPPEESERARPRRKKPEPPPAAASEQPTVEGVFGKSPSRRERTGPTLESVFGKDDAEP